MSNLSCVWFLMLVLCHSGYSVTIPGGCSKAPLGIFAGGPSKLSNNIPVLQAATDTFQPLLGGHKINGWTMFSASVVQMHGLWCQVNPTVNFTTPVNWYVTTGLNTLDPVQITRPATFPYELFQCSNQTGVTLVGDFNRYQGIVKCNTTAPRLRTLKEYYFSVYTIEVFNNYRGPIVEPKMVLNIISRTIEEFVLFTLSFNVTFGLPSRVSCTDVFERQLLFDSREAPVPNLSREVLQTHYFNSTLADTTRVTITLNNVEKKERLYACNVFVEGYNGTTGELIEMGTAASHIAISVASAPVNLTVTPIVGSNSVFLEWSAPPQPPSFYEVFYQSLGDSVATSRGVVTMLSTTLVGLQRGQLYRFYVVGFEKVGNVLPSQRSNEAMLLVDPSSAVATPTTATPLATLTDVRLTAEDPLAPLMFAGWSLFFITLFIFIVFLIVCCCKRRRQRKNSSLPPISATDPIRQDEELYDSIDQLDETTHDEDITMRECDAYESATNSNNHQTHNDEDIAMTECDAYGVNYQPQPDIVNSRPSDQQPQNTDDEEYVDVNDYV